MVHSTLMNTARLIPTRIKIATVFAITEKQRLLLKE